MRLRNLMMLAGLAATCTAGGCSGKKSVQDPATQGESLEQPKASVEVSASPVVDPTAQPVVSDVTPSVIPDAPIDGDREAQLRGYLKRSRQKMDAGDFAGALADSEQALALDAGNAKALHVHGRALLALNRPEPAIEALSLAHETAPENGYIANTLGYALIQNGKPSEAIPYLEAARELIPKIAYVHNNLAVAYERSGRKEEAIGEYRTAVELGDSDGKAAMSLARLGVTLQTAEPEAVVSQSSSTDGDSTQN